MESDAGGTESDISDWDPAYAGLTSENSEDSDENGIYYGDSLTDDLVEYENHRHVVSGFAGYALQRRASLGESAYNGPGSLYPIHEHEPGTGEVSDDDDDKTRSEEADYNVGSDEPVYGRYQKLGVSGHSGSLDGIENVVLHRLPGENLGMILGIEDGKSGKVSCVAVKSVTLGGAAYRATGSSKGICTSDQIVAVNGRDLRKMTNDECVQVFKDMPLRVMLGIRRGQKDLPAVSISPAPMFDNQHTRLKGPNVNKSERSKQVHITKKPDLSDSEDDGFGGFAIYQVLVEKDADENLGISIVPSYGSTKEYYQVKRILPSGAAARSGKLEVGDRLITCNGTSLEGLTQTHCLDIIKSASCYGDVQFEVIRPVYHGNSMQISVTVNSGVNNANSRTNNIATSFDPSQYSLKSQSYDRQGIDVIVTSESEDYLTVSEDEYSRSGRLANISEVEANEVFVTNSVRLAFQKDIDPIEGESSETDFDERLYNISKKQKYESDTHKPLDLATYKIQPIPRKRGHFDKDKAPLAKETEKQTDIPSNLGSPLPKSDLDLVSPRSPLPKSNLDLVSPRSPLLKSNLDLVSPRSPLSKSDIDLVSPRSPLPKSDIDLVSPRSPLPKSNLDLESPRSPLPNSELDQVYPTTPSRNIVTVTVSSKPSTRNPESSKSTILSSNLRENSPQPPLPWSDVDQLSPRSSVPSHRLDNSYLKRQQVPSDSELSDLELPYNYPAEYIGQNIPVIDTEETRYNPLYEDSNLSEFTDSEPQDIYIPSPVHKRNKGFSDKDLDTFSVESDRTLTRTDIDTVSVDSRLKVKAFNQNSEEDISVPPPLEFSDTKRAEPEQSENKFVEEYTDTEFNADIEDVSEYEEEIDSAKLAFNSELTAPFDIVLQEQGIIVNSSPTSIDEFDEDIFHQVENEPVYENIESFDRSGYFVSRFAPSHEKIMDNNSEIVLKSALDFEYDNLSESKKQQGRLELIENNHVMDFEDPMFVNHNIVAENIAKDIVQEENRVGYFVESDDEPDEFPEQDLPEEVPDLPTSPPPDVNSIYTDGSNNVVVISVNGETTEKQDDEISHAHQQRGESTTEGFDDREHDVIIPTKIERKVEIPINLIPHNENIDDQDSIIPEAVQRTFQFPTEFKENKVPLEANYRLDDLDNWVSVTTLTSEPESGKMVTSLEIENSESDQEEVDEEIIEPVNVMKDHAKDLVKVISVVNALKKASQDKEPDIVDQIEKEEKKKKLRDFQMQ